MGKVDWLARAGKILELWRTYLKLERKDHHDNILLQAPAAGAKKTSQKRI